MTPDNMPSPPEPKMRRSALRPPEILLPQADKAAARKRNGEPDVYVSWGGQIYGPSSLDEVIGGVRTSYFEEDALFWFEGREEWRPVAELSVLMMKTDDPEGLPVKARQHSAPSEGIKPSWPGARKSHSSGGERRRRRGHRNRGQKQTRAQLGGRLIVIGAVILAVILTAGLLLLVS